MGTSKSSSGEVHTKPLVPSWIEIEETIGNSENVEENQENMFSVETPLNTVNVNVLQDAPQTTSHNRLRTPRIYFNKFVRSKKSNIAYLKKTVSKYIGTGMKGSKNLSRRMKSEKNAVIKIASILWQANDIGIRQVFPSDKYPLVNLASLQTKEIYVLFVEEIAGSSGMIDTNLIREAYLNTLQEFPDKDASLLENPSKEIRLAFLETFIANTIFERILHSLGNGIIKFSSSIETIEQKETELKDLIKGTVEDIVNEKQNDLTIKNMSIAIDNIYDKALAALESMSEMEE